MEPIFLNHQAIVKYNSYFDLFKNVKSYDELVSIIKNINDDDFKQAKGNLFELYTLWLISMSAKGKDRILPFKNIRAATDPYQKGYDFTAELDNDEPFDDMFPNDRKVFLQMKFRSSGMFPVTKDDEHGLNMLCESFTGEEFRMNDKRRCYIITNGIIVENNIFNRYMKSKYGNPYGNMNYITGAELRHVLDTNKKYFENFYDSLLYSYKKLVEQKIENLRLYTIQRNNMKNLNKIKFGLDDIQKSVFIAPPGLGKTEIEKSVTLRCINNMHNTGKAGTIVIVSPTIALTLQHVKSFYKNISFTDNNIGIACCTGINDEAGNDIGDEKIMADYTRLNNITNASSEQGIRVMLSKFIGNGKPTIIFSTYKSMGKLYDNLIGKNKSLSSNHIVIEENIARNDDNKVIDYNIPRDNSGLIDNIDMIIFDEAHKLITANGADFKCVKNLIDENKVKVLTYFTATPKVSSSLYDTTHYTAEAIEDETMEWSDDHNLVSFSNRYVFGDKIDIIDYNEAKNKGYICDTRIDFINRNGAFEKAGQRFENFMSEITKRAKKSLSKKEYGFTLNNNGKLIYKGIADGTGKGDIEIDLIHVAGILAALESNVQKINRYALNDLKCRVIVFAKSVSEAMAYNEIINELTKSNFWNDSNKWISSVVHSGIIKERSNIINQTFGQKDIEEDVKNGVISADKLSNTVIFHYDTLSEGIDVPSVTGVLIDRDLSNDPITMRQGLGRGGRITTADRIKFINDDGVSNTVETIIKSEGDNEESQLEIRKLLSDKSKFEKPYNWVIAIDDTIVQVTDFIDMIKKCGITIGTQDVDVSCGSVYQPDIRISTEGSNIIGLESEEQRFLANEKNCYSSTELYDNSHSLDLDTNEL